MRIQYTDLNTGKQCIQEVYKAELLPMTKDAITQTIRLHIQDETDLFLDIESIDGLADTVMDCLFKNGALTLTNFNYKIHQRSASSKSERLQSWFASRIPFVVDAWGIKYALGKCQYKSSMDWLTEDLRYSWSGAEEAIRGHLAEGRVALYTGKNFEEIDMSFISKTKLEELALTCCRLYGTDSVAIENGQVLGEHGVRWAPIQEVTTMYRYTLENN